MKNTKDMTVLELVEFASRQKLRFPIKGPSTRYEDLWDLTDEELKELMVKVTPKNQGVLQGTVFDNEVQDRIPVAQMRLIEHVFITRKKEADARKIANDAKRDNELLKNQIRSALNEKRHEELVGEKTVAELEALLATLS